MKRSPTWAIVLLSIGVFMAALDNGIISSALTTIYYSFGVTPNWGAWTVTIYTLGIAVSVPIIGKLSDRYGRKRLFLIEVILFGIGSLLVALSTSFPMLLASRFLQSLGGGGIFIIASSYVLSTFPQEKQGKALGMLGGLNGIAAILGPNFGSVILDLTGNWHWLFLINIPIAITLVILGSIFIEETKEPNTLGLDWAGIGLLMISVLSLMYGFTQLNGVHVLDSIQQPQFFGFVGFGLLCLLILLFVEKRVTTTRKKDPILPMKLLGNASYLWTLVIGFFSGAILASVIFIPSYVEQYLGVAADRAGYWVTPLALASGLGAGGGGALVDRRGPIFTIVIGSLLAATGFLLFPLWVDATWQMAIASSFVGIGFGMMLGAPINVLATESTSDKGTALGTLSLFRQVAMTLAPTIYAGYIARSFSSIGGNIQESFKNTNLQLPQASDEMSKLSEFTDFQNLLSAVHQIPVPQVRDLILTTIHETIKMGYDALFYSGAIIAGLTLISVVTLSQMRKRVQSSSTISEAKS
ncbi:MFS transporter [Hazenella coriacea]|uniref:EmrB/QacA subfamily drug resistance transporter n=1 Tax=Hazenella coriacea TaxID=1179467 RepID=A0A4R3LC36_9BACL|nr:MFS transporter [Hazenella coriacea]TCS96868.1 EmrB/QacA subfamily drug resistance transporter [Hazenella coriacea]